MTPETLFMNLTPLHGVFLTGVEDHHVAHFETREEAEKFCQENDYRWRPVGDTKPRMRQSGKSRH